MEWGWENGVGLRKWSGGGKMEWGWENGVEVGSGFRYPPESPATATR